MASQNHQNLRVMRTAAWMWIVYLAALAVVDIIIYAGGPIEPILWYHFYQGCPALLFLGLAYSPWLKNNQRSVTLLMILIISTIPIMISHFPWQRLPQAPLSNLEGMILRQLPVLFIGLVLTAWYYSLSMMVIYSFAINFYELAVVYLFKQLEDPRFAAFNFIILIRTVCFIVVGIFINQLINNLRSQQESLKTANNRLAHYASTLESLTVSRERNRMSRELHDTVVHSLSGLSVQLETAKAYLDVDPETSRNLIGQALEATRSGLQETRRAIKALRASPLEDLGLIVSIRNLVETAAERGKLVPEIYLPDRELLLSPDVEQCIYRIAQEAVENVVHHANAQHLAVKLTANDGEIHLLVQDDGIGFNQNGQSPAGHFGLAGMRERAQLAGGVLTVDSKTSSGTTVQLMIKGSLP